jgi:hypothetical protein
MNKFAVVACAAWFVAAAGATWAESNRVVLITPQEAQLPVPSKSDLTFRAGISRGPAITLALPASADSLKSPVHLQLKFAGRGGAQIDVESLKLLYVRTPAVDLTQRVKAFASANGIDIPEAELPPGTHTIRAEIKDKEGRPGFASFDLNVSK